MSDDGTDAATSGDPPGSGEDGDATDEFAPDPERVALLRDVADDVRGDTTERKQLANLLYRVSDLYDEHEDTSPEEVYRNLKFILDVKERGGLER